ncbi:MAG: rhodanese-like domain-containing protein, partial [Anaerolineales bacterium]
MKKLTWLLTIVMLLGLVLSACGGDATVAEPAVVDNTTENNTQVNEPEPEPVVDEPAMFDAADLDAMFNVFLDDMEGYNTISLDALNTALVENPPFLLDVRSAEEAEGSGHIEGSVLIPLRDLAENLAYLPSFDTPIVSYCGSGWRCTIALTVLEGMGWEDVKGLKGGSFTGWMDGGYAYVEGVEPEAEMLNAAEVDPAVADYFDEILKNYVPEGWGVVKADALNTMIVENPDLILIDVRTAEEVESKGVIDGPNVINIPLQEFIDRKAEWPAKDASIVVYCGSGHRSTIAATILWSYEYDNVGSLKDGFGGWTSEGYATVGGAPDLDAAFTTFLADMEGYNTISLDALNTALVENPPFLLDVRNASEPEGSGHIEGSVLIPLRDLADNVAYLPSFDTPIVSYCGSGWRCTIALTVLEA